MQGLVVLLPMSLDGALKLVTWFDAALCNACAADCAISFSFHLSSRHAVTLQW